MCCFVISDADGEEEGEEEEDSESDDEDDGPGLSAIYNGTLDDDEDGEDFEEGEEEEDGEEEEEEEDEESKCDDIFLYKTIVNQSLLKNLVLEYHHSTLWSRYR